MEKLRKIEENCVEKREKLQKMTKFPRHQRCMGHIRANCYVHALANALDFWKELNGFSFATVLASLAFVGNGARMVELDSETEIFQFSGHLWTRQVVSTG